MKMFSLSFWVQIFISTLLTMLVMYLIKKTLGTANIPFVSDVIAEV